MKKFYLALIVLQLTPALINAQQKKSSNQIPRPKLVVGLVIDQMRWDYLVRFQDRFSSNGFRRLLNDGFNYHNAYMPFSPAVTAAGHASVYTGAYPATHGIVGNAWVERKDESYMYCTTDTSVTGLDGSRVQGQMSPKNLFATTIGDELRLATNFRSRVYGVALKDRGGILAAGRSGNAAYWFDDSTGNWISSTWYMRQLPEWVKRYNAAKKPDSMMKKKWDLLYPANSYRQSTEDDMPFERTLPHENQRTFPHDYTSLVNSSRYNGFRLSPYGNTLTLDFSLQLLETERLGKGMETDMLCVSLSSTDYLGHTFGPDAIETEDMYLRLDLEIADFLSKLDQHIGRDNYVLFLTADHGAPNTPGYLVAKGFSAGSVNAYSMVAELDKFCEQRFGNKGILRRYSEYQFFLDRIRIDSLKLNFSAIADSLVNYLEAKPEVAKAFRYDKLSETILTAEQRTMVENGYFRMRNGDIHFFLKPQFTDHKLTGTDHGSTYNYDTHIPLIFYGMNIKAGETFRKVKMTDIAPTISAILKVQPPNASVGEVLEEIVK